MKADMNGFQISSPPPQLAKVRRDENLLENQESRNAGKRAWMQLGFLISCFPKALFIPVPSKSLKPKQGETK